MSRPRRQETAGAGDEPEGAGVDEQLRREVNLLHANLCQALADPTRILILYALRDSPRHVSEDRKSVV